MQDHDEGLTVRQVAKRLNCADETIIDMIRSGKLRGNKISHRWRVSALSVNEFLNGGPAKVETRIIVRRLPPAKLPAVPMRIRAGA